MTSLEYALKYAEISWSVFPCHFINDGACSCGKTDCNSPGKHPMTRHGVKEASNDPSIVREWWEQSPRANIGIATGPDSGVFVIDLDGQEGIDAFATLQEENGPVPSTPTVWTGGGGQHLFFAYPNSKVIKTRTKIGGQSIDVRGDSGYVIAPPSSHVLGKDYRWEVPPFDSPLAVAPDWVLELITAPHAAVRVESSSLFDVSLDLDTAPGVSEGQRHDRLLRLVGSHIAKGQSSLDVLEKAKSWGQKCSPPMDKDEIFRIVRDIDAKERGKAIVLANDAPWPKLDTTALYGLPGEIVTRLEPHTEADPVAILAQLLVMFGNIIGSSPYHLVEATKHHTNLFATLVGKTAKGRKGTSLDHVRSLFTCIEDPWINNRIMSGLSSGEGVITNVRDRTEKREPIKEKGKVIDYQTAISDDGIKDKRLMIVESELASALKVMRREGNNLSPIIRQAWDNGNLQVLTKNTPVRATGAHVSIIGHITKDELCRCMTDAELFNGFANRFIWLCVKRVRLLPEGGQRPDMSDFMKRFQAAANFARSVEEIVRDDDAKTLWASIYEELSYCPPGLVGAVTSRAEAQVLRLSMIYALLDAQAVVGVRHLRAAKALWDYAADSARHIFGSSTGDSLADRVLKIISAGPVAKREIYDKLHRHVKADDLNRVLEQLRSGKLIVQHTTNTGGRPAEVWSRAG